MRRAGLCVICVSLLGAGVGAAARADGLPVVGVDVGGSGVATLSGDARYVTLPAGAATVVARVDPNGGRVLASRRLRGVYTIPAVAYDGSADGLSADGRTLVLIQPRIAFPRAWTALVVLGTRGLQPRRLIRLQGDFSFDAISPRGSLLYLIQYVSPRDPSRYVVRAYDLRAGRLLAGPVIDPREPGEKMRGVPLTRAWGAGGRWAYTLYDGGPGETFVHALDTRARSARCIDLDGIGDIDLSRLRLRPDDASRTLSVTDGLRAVAVIDARTFGVSVPATTGWLSQAIESARSAAR